MKIGFLRFLGVLALAFSTLGLIPAQAGIVTNGSFEVDTITDPIGWQYFASLTGWNLDTTLSAPGVTSIELQQGYIGTAQNGSKFVELNSTGSSYIYQDLATTAGDVYNLTFAFSARPQYSNCVGAQTPANCQPSGGQSITEDGTINRLQALVGAPGALSVVYDQTASGVGLFDTSWILNTIAFTATGPTTRIEFGHPGVSSLYGTELDNVDVNFAAPEPGTVFMLGAGALGILISRARKNRQ